MVAHVFSPTATQGGRRIGNARMTALVRGGSTSMRTAIIRYAPRAVGLKPSAMRGEARLRGLRRN